MQRGAEESRQERNNDHDDLAHDEAAPTTFNSKHSRTHDNGVLQWSPELLKVIQTNHKKTKVGSSTFQGIQNEKQDGANKKITTSGREHPHLSQEADLSQEGKPALSSQSDTPATAEEKEPTATINGSQTEEDRRVLEAVDSPLHIEQIHCAGLSHLTVPPLLAALYNSRPKMQQSRRSLYFTATASDEMRLGCQNLLMLHSITSPALRLIDPMVRRFRNQVDIVLGAACMLHSP